MTPDAARALADKLQDCVDLSPPDPATGIQRMIMDDSGVQMLQAFAAQVRREALTQAWHIARDGCLVPPDGGSPTEDEVAICDHISGNIRTLMAESPLPEGRALIAAPNCRLISAAREMAAALSALVDIFHARPDILVLCGFHENAQIKAACDALNKALPKHGATRR